MSVEMLCYKKRGGGGESHAQMSLEILSSKPIKIFFFFKLKDFLEPVLCNVHCDSHNGDYSLTVFPLFGKALL